MHQERRGRGSIPAVTILYFCISEILCSTISDLGTFGKYLGPNGTDVSYRVPDLYHSIPQLRPKYDITSSYWVRGIMKVHKVKLICLLTFFVLSLKETRSLSSLSFKVQDQWHTAPPNFVNKEQNNHLCENCVIERNRIANLRVVGFYNMP